MYEDTGRRLLNGPAPHERIIGEITKMFMSQMIIPWDNTANGPTFYTTGSEVISPTPTPTLPSISKRNLISQIYIIQADVTADQSFIPVPPNPQNRHRSPRAIAADLARGWPTLSSKSVTPSLPAFSWNPRPGLGHQTQVNVFVGISYNRTRHGIPMVGGLASPFATPIPNPLQTRPPRGLLAPSSVNRKDPGGDTKTSNTPLGNTIWRVPTALLYILNPSRSSNPSPANIMWIRTSQAVDRDTRP